MKIAIPASLILAFCTLSCTKSDTKNCTTSFAYISLPVLDSLGKPVKLDSYYTEIVLGGETLILPVDSPSLALTGYPVITDSEMSKLAASGSAVKFLGFRSSKKIVDASFVIGQDGCHITRISGPDKVVVK